MIELERFFKTAESVRKDKFNDLRTIKEKSQEQEKQVAKKLGGRTTAASGALHSDKGDVSTDDFLVECKRTDKAQLSLKKEWLQKIKSEAGMKTPLLHFEIQEEKWVAMPESWFLYLKDKI